MGSEQDPDVETVQKSRRVLKGAAAAEAAEGCKAYKAGSATTLESDATSTWESEGGGGVHQRLRAGLHAVATQHMVCRSRTPKTLLVTCDLIQPAEAQEHNASHEGIKASFMSTTRPS
jgi:hypothetical protein